MVKNIIKDHETLIKELIDNKVISEGQYKELIALCDSKTLIEVIIAEGILTNEEVVDLLSRNGEFELLSSSDEQIIICDYAKLEEYTKYGYFYYNSPQGSGEVAINNITLLIQLLRFNPSVECKLIRSKDFYALIDLNFQQLNISKARYLLGLLSPLATAKNIYYQRLLICFLIIFTSSLWYFPLGFHIINNICFALQNGLNTLLFTRSLNNNISYPQALLTKFPIYTILIPLYNEPLMLNSILSFIVKLQYPKYRLDVKIIIEADDILTAKSLLTFELPHYIQVITVPYCEPRTKPKALNYALQFAKGDYLVIYDAEDQPDPYQLQQAVLRFQELPAEYACLQAKLNFFNANENLLTKFCSIEYSLWFNHLLKGLSLLNLPLTLGGSSNHFKLPILQQIGGWDAYNVTEDADIGIRLSLHGYKITILDSLTLEEAPLTIFRWLNQRARWIQGFIQTILVFFRQPKSRFSLKPYHIISVYIFIGLSSYNFFCLPWLLILFAFYLPPMMYYMWLFNSFFAFSYLYATAFFLCFRSSPKPFSFLDLFALLLWPCYFLLHVLAAYKAIYSLFFYPFFWHKTKHGLSSFSSY